MRLLLCMLALMIGAGCGQRTTSVDVNDSKVRYDTRMKQRACADRLEVLEVQRLKKVVASKPDKCFSTTLPVGSYVTREDEALWMRLSVRSDGCAAWEAFVRDNVGFKQELTDKRGTFERDYQRIQDCFERGFVAGTSPERTVWDGAGCDPGKPLLDAELPVVRNSVVIVYFRGESVALSSVPNLNLDSIWLKARRGQGIHQQRVSLAFQETPRTLPRDSPMKNRRGEGDWCALLAYQE